MARSVGNSFSICWLIRSHVTSSNGCGQLTVRMNCTGPHCTIDTWIHTCTLQVPLTVCTVLPNSIGLWVLLALDTVFLGLCRLCNGMIEFNIIIIMMASLARDVASYDHDPATQHCPTAVGWMHPNASMVWPMYHAPYREVASKMGMGGTRSGHQLRV